MKRISNVFWITVILVAASVAYGAIAPNSFETVTAKMQTFITSTFGWYYLILVTVIVIFCVFLIFSPMGTIRLGKPDEKPEYTRGTWFAMLFSAGMGIGLVFWGAAEPLSHYMTPPTAEGGTDLAIKESMRYTFFHWGIHAWGIYAIVALALAYSKFRKDEPGLISATLKPIFGDKMNGPLGTIIDVLAVFATVVGVATTLGFGAAQINGGLSYLLDIPNNFTVQAIIIGVVTVLFMISAWSGLSKGIKYLSNTNMVLAVLLLVLVFFIGPTLLILNMFTDTIGAYIQNIAAMSFRIAPLNEEHRTWINGWTIFYWAWWISWSPFVGIFIARVSRGRTIREFLIGVLLLPALVSFIWFATFGTSAIEVQQAGAALSDLKTEEVLFAVFNGFEWSTILSVIAITLIGTFFITSADSATFVLGMQTTYGSLTPPNYVKLTWGLAQSTVALILLYSGGLQALQNALIVAALPFSVIMALMMVSLYKSLNQEKKELGLYIKPKPRKTKEPKEHM
ncbi:MULTISPECIES: BCCT family transporter [Rossellomorea]|jgi:choline/carnitine/betaine transport|uniref:glycine betaine uptake BCCT transporter n=1 Tax=Rossellomorea TaxID=2837508 RepID=UPI0005579C0C|nr:MULTISPECIES: BCCT family transporter [Rossellomorea]MCA0148222.1 BCCT family transporter [Rossellomorea vietnamensis]MCC5802497.1 BCCT family transporter [Rossellomorea vietnamensis]UTE75770.1 BCCT family transporter [Rossellomorea sp. KS-H15a]WGG43597.1 BCCT family transporter [Rossellomorea sp. DA94]